MDRGTDACAYLSNEVVPLRLGYIGVVNRCQQDIAQRRSIREARAAENEFFRHHPAYAEVQHKCGVEALGWTVSRILGDHIADVLPTLAEKVSKRREAASREMKELGEGRPDDPGLQSSFVLEKLHAFRCVPYTGSHTTAFAWWTLFLKDFARRISPPRVPRFQSPISTPFNFS